MIDKFTVQEKFPDVDEMARLWGWIQECPEANIDDAGPKSIDDFYVVMKAKAQRGVVLFVVSTDLFGPIGCFGLEAFGNGLVKFAGLCFAPYVRGTGLAQRSVTGVLERLSPRKVVVEFFETNKRAVSFFEDLGFTFEGRFTDETIIKGEPVAVVRWVKFPKREE